MLLFMVDNRGRHRIGELVKAVMAWDGRTPTAIDREGRISRATVNRARAGREMGDTMYRALGDVLGLPKDYLLYVGAGDIRKVEASGADPDLVRWTVDLIRSDDESDQVKQADA